MDSPPVITLHIYIQEHHTFYHSFIKKSRLGEGSIRVKCLGAVVVECSDIGAIICTLQEVQGFLYAEFCRDNFHYLFT